MFEDGSDDEGDADDFNNARASPSADPVAQATSVQESSKDMASQEPVAPAATEAKSSLFQADAFAGMDMDLFSDEED